MVIRTYIILFFLLIAFSACKDSSDYNKSDKGFEYKFIQESEENEFIKQGDHIRLSVKYFNETDSLLFNTDDTPGDFRMNVSNDIEDGLLHEAVKMMKVGDSAHFLISAENFYTETAGILLPDFIKEKEELRFELKIIKRFTDEELDDEFEQYLLRQETKEKQLLSEYLSIEQITVTPSASGIYIIYLEKGTGTKASPGKTVLVHYEGKLINGELFDSSLEKGEPLEFTIGNNEVIQAWEDAVVEMRVGDKIRLIAPSYTAYGKVGYPPYIPPFSTLIFDMKLVEVKE